MSEKQLTEEQIQEYENQLRREEKSSATIEKYIHYINSFADWTGDRFISSELVSNWKKELLSQGKAPTTVNGAIAAINSFFRFMEWEDCCSKFLKLQRKMFRDERKELTKSEYYTLISAARKQGKERLALLTETICATGIRVSEVKYMTIEAVREARAEIYLKGKIRIILIPAKLCHKLLKYAQKQKIVSGEIFITRNGTSLGRRQIWAEMKNLCSAAGIDEEKVFPHNLRHLFATEFYQTCRDIVKLADVLGHSSIETTRIYLLASGTEHRYQLNRMELVLILPIFYRYVFNQDKI